MEEITIDDVNELLDEIASEIPEEIFKGLNGGVNLLEETKTSKSDPNGNLYTMGEYRRDQMGKYIYIYYGSIIAVYGNISRKRMRNNLKKILTHELTHHLEAQAGARDLEVKDKEDLERYLNKQNKLL